MHDPNTITSLSDLLIYEDDELIFDGSDPSTHIVCTSRAQIAAALAELATNLQTLSTVDSLDDLRERIDVLSRAAFTADPRPQDPSA